MDWESVIGIRLVRVPRSIRSHQVGVRAMRLTDLSTLARSFREETFSTSRGLATILGNIFLFRQWTSRTFQAFYLIEKKATDGNKIAGFIGLYNITLGVCMSLAAGIFDPADRGQGLAHEAVELFLDSLRSSKAASMIQVEVDKSNLRSIHLFDRLGFELCQCLEDCFVMNKYL